MMSFGQCTLVVIVLIKCSLAVAVNELEVAPQINLIAGEVKKQLDKAKKAPGQPCQGRPTVGFCKMKIMGYTFDPDLNSCKKFVGGGCETSNNTFGTKEDCEAKCSTPNVEIRTNLKEGEGCGSCYRPFCPDYCIPVSNHSSICGKCGEGLKCRPSVTEYPGKCIKKRGKRCDGSPVTSGICGGRYKGFTFNSKTAKCEPFADVGCGLSENGFKSEKMCQRTCRKKQKGRSGLEWTRPALCNLNKKTGCEAAFPRFYFNKKTGKCEKFIYGGCGGNKNNFKKKTSCEITCGVIGGFSG